jgi:hypothetical protein
MTDVGDAAALTFSTTTGATVTAEVYDGGGLLVQDATAVTETPSGSGLWPFTFIGSTPGQWRCTFRSTGPTQVESYFVTFEAVDRPAPFCSVDDYEKRVGLAPTTGTKRAQIEAKLDDASGMIRDHMPKDFTPKLTTARTIVVDMVQRAIANPGGLRQVLVGSYSELRTTESGMYITDEEMTRLLGQAGPDSQADGAYTIGLVDHGLHWSHVGQFGHPHPHGW